MQTFKELRIIYAEFWHKLQLHGDLPVIFSSIDIKSS
jgi:hypothetical protein